MNGWIWLAPAASFVGAGLAYLGAWCGVRQREGQGRREEWGRRFTAALAAISSTNLRERKLGRLVLSELAKSELATAEERRLVDKVLNQDVAYDSHFGDLRLVEDAATLDEAQYIRDDE